MYVIFNILIDWGVKICKTACFRRWKSRMTRRAECTEHVRALQPSLPLERLSWTNYLLPSHSPWQHCVRPSSLTYFPPANSVHPSFCVFISPLAPRSAFVCLYLKHSKKQSVPLCSTGRGRNGVNTRRTWRTAVHGREVMNSSAKQLHTHTHQLADQFLIRSP